MSLAGDMDPTAVDSPPTDPLLKACVFTDSPPILSDNFVIEPEPEPVSGLTGAEEHQTPAVQPAGSDPLLKAGTFIDPHPISDETYVPEPELVSGFEENQTPADQTVGSDPLFVPGAFVDPHPISDNIFEFEEETVSEPVSGETGPEESQTPAEQTAGSDPLLNPGAFIDPHPVSNDTFVPEPVSGQKVPEEPQTPADQKAGSDPTSLDPTSLDPTQFDWLPPGWTVVERVRAKGASAGSRDKYYLNPETKRRFRSKKEVLTHLGFEVTPYKRKKKEVFDADTTPQAKTETAQKPKAKSETTQRKRRKKSEGSTVKDSAKQFNFDDVPEKVKWELTDVNKAKWQPSVNSVDKVPESAKKEWDAAFTYLTIPNEESVLL